MAPVERWLGSLRSIVVFAIGHVTATIVVAFVLDRGLIAFTDSDTTRFTIDVGVSYGYYCIAAMFTYRLRGRWWWSWIWAAGLSALVIVPFVQDRTFTSFGHLVTTGHRVRPLPDLAVGHGAGAVGAPDLEAAGRRRGGVAGGHRRPSRGPSPELSPTGGPGLISRRDQVAVPEVVAAVVLAGAAGAGRAGEHDDDVGGALVATHPDAALVGAAEGEGADEGVADAGALDVARGERRVEL